MFSLRVSHDPVCHGHAGNRYNCLNAPVPGEYHCPECAEAQVAAIRRRTSLLPLPRTTLAARVLSRVVRAREWMAGMWRGER